MKPGITVRTIESSQGCWNERRAGCATMKPLRYAQDTCENHYIGYKETIFSSRGYQCCYMVTSVVAPRARFRNLDPSATMREVLGGRSEPRGLFPPFS